ncbi:MAG: pyridoxal phosphate-dependent aminotransferase, partial [Chloroflexota bacterium]|nr:pyridoxal phosphate-dependent aminotransferase [Chloroflexota bacterium]
MAAAFEVSEADLRARRGVKWHHHPEDVMPAWVADMDFAVADPVQAAIARVVDQGDYGYPYRSGEESLTAAFVERMQERFGWTVDPALVQPVTECVQCMYGTALAFSEPGEGIVLQTPIYPPFLGAIGNTGRRMIENRLKDDGTRYVLDVEGLRGVVDETTRILMICNPHNPTGRAFSRDELMALGNLAVERDLVILCDEIHADLLYAGSTHIPMATLSPEIAARTITITSATKSFNIAGLRCAVMHFGSADLQARFRARVPDSLMGQIAIVGTDATVAAWRHAQPWLDEVMVRLQSNRDYVAQFIAEEMPGIHHYKPEGTYLAWLDCRALDLPGSPYQFFLEHAKVGLNDGAAFGEAGKTCVRLNFATSETVLREVLSRMASAVQRVHTSKI